MANSINLLPKNYYYYSHDCRAEKRNMKKKKDDLADFDFVRIFCLVNVNVYEKPKNKSLSKNFRGFCLCN